MTEEMEQEEHQVETTEMEAMPDETLSEDQPKAEFNLHQTNKLLQDHIELLRAQQPKPAPSTNPEFNFESDDDILTVGQAKRAFQEMQRANEELRVAARHKDYEEVITKFLPEAIKENPHIRDWIENSNSPYEQAYYMAKKSDAYLKERVAKSRSQDAAKLSKNTKTAGNLSAIGANSTARGTTDYKSMSDSDFDALVARNLWG